MDVVLRLCVVLFLCFGCNVARGAFVRVAFVLCFFCEIWLFQMCVHVDC